MLLRIRPCAGLLANIITTLVREFSYEYIGRKRLQYRFAGADMFRRAEMAVAMKRPAPPIRGKTDDGGGLRLCKRASK